MELIEIGHIVATSSWGIAFVVTFICGILLAPMLLIALEDSPFWKTCFCALGLLAFVFTGCMFFSIREVEKYEVTDVNELEQFLSENDDRFVYSYKDNVLIIGREE